MSRAYMSDSPPQWAVGCRTTSALAELTACQVNVIVRSPLASCALLSAARAEGAA